MEFSHIVESPVIQTEISTVPLGWNNGGVKDGEPLKVYITGFGWHLCTHVQVNGNWCCHYAIKHHLLV